MVTKPDTYSDLLGYFNRDCRSEWLSRQARSMISPTDYLAFRSFLPKKPIAISAAITTAINTAAVLIAWTVNPRSYRATYPIAIATYPAPAFIRQVLRQQCLPLFPRE